MEEIKDNDKDGFSSAVELEYDYNKSKEVDIEFVNKSFLRWDNQFWTFYFFNEIDFNRLDKKDLANDGQQHFRVCYHLKDKYSIESFVQNKKDLVLNLQNRFLSALGLKSKLPFVDYIGIYTIYEYEQIIGGQPQRDMRISFSNQFTYNVMKKAVLTSNFHYQPNIKELYDYRLAFEVSLSFPVLNNLFLKNTFVLDHDTYPANDNLPRTTYQLKNSLIYKFTKK